MAHRQPPSVKGYVCLGVITDAHGIQGEIKLKSFTEAVGDIANYGTLMTEHQRPFVIQKVRQGPKGLLIVRVEDIKTRNDAEGLRGTFIYAERSALPEIGEGETFYVDLIGSVALWADGKEAGVVKEVFHNGAHDVIDIQTDSKRILIPFVGEFVGDFDSTKKQLQLTAEAVQFLDI